MSHLGSLLVPLVVLAVIGGGAFGLIYLGLMLRETPVVVLVTMVAGSLAGALVYTQLLADGTVGP